MPFERYLNPPSDNSDSSSDYPHTYESGRQDHALDQSIFTPNVQFQMPQLMMGPSLPPGGGAEVLPAGIVGNVPTVTSSWLATANTRQGYTYDPYWMVTPSEPMSVAHPLVLPPYCSSSSRPQRTAHTPDSSLSSPTTAPPYLYNPVYHSSHTSLPNAPAGLLSCPLPLAVPHAGGLPVYSASGFDLLSILARVATRPNPKIMLGPVDMTCSFVVVDVRRFDSPIVYASPTFYRLTGYSEHEIVGRNCRFLQSPIGNVQRGEQRHHTAHEAVSHMRKSLSADKECQVSLINYRKNGTAFVNLVTVIPVRGGVHNTPEEEDDVVYQVGFQVDLTEQPSAILQKLRDGSYMVNYSNNAAYPSTTSNDSSWRTTSHPPGVSKALRAALNNPELVKSLHLSTSTTALSMISQDRNERNDPYDSNRPLSLLLLETSPDYVQVLSLKGAFLYVSPSVRRVLGYEPEDLVGKSITDFCHEADKVPLVRELKESSSLLPPPNSSNQPPQDGQPSSGNVPSAGPRVVDLLFRMRVKDGLYVWMECRGRLHVEPGKGRKAIILSAGVRNMPSLSWGPLARAGGLACPVQQLVASEDGTQLGPKEQEQEFWALLSTGGSFLFVGAAVRDVLGWGSGEVMGRSFCDFIGGHDPAQGRIVVEETLSRAFLDARESRSLSCELKQKDGSQIAVEVVFYHSPPDHQLSSASTASLRPLVCQVKVCHGIVSPAATAQLVHSPTTEVFDELDVSRASSWQFELQQLKVFNKRLRDEVEILEAQVKQESDAQYRSRVQRLSMQHSVGNGWPTHSQNVTDHVRTSSKRAWGS